MSDVPIDGQVLMLTAAKASVPADRLPDLVERAQTALEADLEEYRPEYERVYAGPGTENGDGGLEAFLVEWGHWETVGEELGFERRERAAVRRAHEEQLLRLGRRADREDEFETSLEIREPVLVGVDAPDTDAD
ncbi:hypothetical protein SAMN05444422_101275 [Halobiforma haloterrestris]|uniref:DUF8048 domain-containing protein n=1 Tax=Natronobacterium haloterrestre TaxID=148448 RepID=A0A1I1DB03_NATHA|nr:hypothetical protein [Halobiforma haloterrestris]SFB69723.1 hypothetical protein SAMN05444422_101275 [Halobiforma haloterrestris]